MCGLQRGPRCPQGNEIHHSSFCTMVKSQNKNKNKTKNSNGKSTKTKKMVNRLGGKSAGGRSLAYADKVLRLYRDPCRADLVYPPYEGTDAGYLVRTVDIVQPSVAPYVDGVLTGDYYLSWSPWNYGTTSGYIVGGSTANGPFPTVSFPGPGNFINSAVVRTYRPVAACLEWVPTDQVLTRSGTVSMGYVPSVPVDVSYPSAVNTIAKILPLCLNTATNGFDKNYSINWLPSMNDERFTTSAGTIGGVGTVFCALQGVQLEKVSVVGENATLRGFFRVTTVWEWTPEFNNGIVVDPRTPSGWSVAEVLARAGDIKGLLLGAMDTVGSAIRFASRFSSPGPSIGYY